MLHLTAKNFNTETAQTRLPAIIMFYADWCAKCAMMKPVFEDIEKKHLGKIKFFEVEIEESPDIAAQYHADIVPTFVFLKEKKQAAVLQGMISQATFERGIQKIFS